MGIVSSSRQSEGSNVKLETLSLLVKAKVKARRAKCRGIDKEQRGSSKNYFLIKSSQGTLRVSFLSHQNEYCV